MAQGGNVNVLFHTYMYVTRPIVSDCAQFQEGWMAQE